MVDIKTRAEIAAEIAENLPSNSVGGINAKRLRDSVNAVVDGLYSPLDDPLPDAISTLIDTAVGSGLGAVPITGPETGTSQTGAQIVASTFYIGLGTAYMQRPSGDAASDLSRFAVQQQKGTRYIELQDASTSSPYKIPTGGSLVLNSDQDVIGHGKGTTIIRSAGTPTAHMITADNKARWKLRGISVDYNFSAGAASGSLLAAIEATAASDFVIEDFEVLNLNRFGIALNASARFLIANGRITRASASQQQNQALNVSVASGVSPDGRIENVIATGSGFCLAGDDLVIERCIVEGWGFGSGFTLEAVENSNNHKLLFNIARFSGTLADSNDTIPAGYEVYPFGSTLIGNEAVACGGEGFACGAQAAKYIGNTARDCGKGAAAPGFNVRTPTNNTTYNSNHCTFVGNSAYDDQGTKTQTYGFGTDGGAGLVGVTIDGYSVFSNATGAFDPLLVGQIIQTPPRVVTESFAGATIAAGAAVANNFSAAGVRVASGSVVLASFDHDLQSANVRAWVQADNVLARRIENPTGSSITLPPGTLTYRIIN